MGELLTLLFVCIFGGKRRRREVSEALAENNRQLASLNAHYVAGGICFDRAMAEWNEKMYPDFRKHLNHQRVLAGLPPM